MTLSKIIGLSAKFELDLPIPMKIKSDYQLNSMSATVAKIMKLINDDGAG